MIMLRNVEIKAKVRNLSDIVARAKELSKSEGEIITQHDIFYNVLFGRLKLRTFKDNSSSLVFYDRPDTEGPKLSEYEKCNFPPPGVQGVTTGHEINSILTRSLGVKGELKKTRTLYMVGQTRVHIDNVEGLGDFMELEVVLSPEQTLEGGQKIADDLQEKLGIPKEDLLSGAYIDIHPNKIG